MKTCKDLITMAALLGPYSVVCYRFAKPLHETSAYPRINFTTFTLHGVCAFHYKLSDTLTDSLEEIHVFDDVGEYADAMAVALPDEPRMREQILESFLCIGCGDLLIKTF